MHRPAQVEAQHIYLPMVYLLSTACVQRIGGLLSVVSKKPEGWAVFDAAQDML
jgi:hypothetical protein